MEEQSRVADIMTRSVVVLSEEDNLSQVAAGLDRYRFHHLPVVDGSKLVGMLSQHDMLRHTVSGVDRSAVASSREARYLEQTFVRDVMKTDVLTVRADELVSTAADRMLAGRVSALPVVDAEDALIGIVTEKDILRLVAGQGVLKHTV